MKSVAVSPAREQVAALLEEVPPRHLKLTYLVRLRPKVVANYLVNEEEAAIAWQEKNQGLLRLEAGRLKDA